MENMFKSKKKRQEEERETGRKKYNSADNESRKKERRENFCFPFFTETFFLWFLNFWDYDAFSLLQNFQKIQRLYLCRQLNLLLASPKYFNSFHIQLLKVYRSWKN